MIRILYIVSTLENTGPTNQLYNIISHLPTDIYQAQILTLSEEPINSKNDVFQELNIDVKSLALGHISGMLMGRKGVRNYIQEYLPDIIHTSGIRADYIVSTLKIKIPWCSTIRNNCKEDYKKYGIITGTIMSQIHLKLIRKMPYPICCSKTLKDIYEKELSRKIYRIQNGVDITSFGYDEFERKLLRKKYGIDKERFVFVTVGSLIDRKDPLTIIQSFEKLLVGDALLYVIGEGILLDKCKSVAGKRVNFIGFTKKVREFLLIADAYISASISEGLPNSVLEAGAMGVPMILSDIPQHREIFQNENQMIEYFKVGDSSQLTYKMETIINKNISDSVKKESADKIVSMFSAESMCRKYQKFYEKMKNTDAEGEIRERI